MGEEIKKPAKSPEREVPAYANNQKLLLAYHDRKTSRKRREQLREQIINNNQKLVQKWASRYFPSEKFLEIEDLVQEGNTGLMRAIDKFNPSYGYQFSTYASYWIRQAIGRAIGDTANTIRIPIHVWEKVNRLRRVRARLMLELEKDPSIARLSEELDAPPETIEEWLTYLTEPRSLSDVVRVGDGENGDTLLEEILEDKRAVGVDSLVNRRIIRESLEETLNSVLSPREQKIIRMRKGLGEDEIVYTLEEVGQEFGVSRERIRQIEKVALRKLRAALTLKGMSADDADDA